MNSITFEGYVCRDAALKDAGSSQVLEFTVPNDVGFGEKKSTNWFKCALWGKQGVSLEQYLKKGKYVVCSGELTAREYKTKDGEDRTELSVRIDRIKLAGRSSENDDITESQPKTSIQDNTEEDAPF